MLHNLETAALATEARQLLLGHLAHGKSNLHALLDELQQCVLIDIGLAALRGGVQLDFYAERECESTGEHIPGWYFSRADDESEVGPYDTPTEALCEAMQFYGLFREAH